MATGLESGIIYSFGWVPSLNMEFVHQERINVVISNWRSGDGINQKRISVQVLTSWWEETGDRSY